MSKIELGKTYRTRDGREVRIYAVDGGGSFTVHGAVKTSAGWHHTSWAADGNCSLGDDLARAGDLIEVRPRIKRTVWLNVPRNPDCCSYAYPSKERAELSNDSRIACVKVDIDVEEGEGL